MKKQQTRKKYDVVIVGAGPAGGQCARELSIAGKKVLLIEKSKEIGQPNFSSAGTPKELLDDFDLPLDFAPGKWSKILIATGNVSKIWDYGATRGYVLDFAGLKKFLVKEAVKHGAKILIGTSVKKPILKDGVIIGVSYDGVFGEGKAFADIIIDASGPAGVLASELGLRKGFNSNLSLGIEFIAENVPKELTKSLAFYFGSAYVPYGYGWIFPMGENSAKIGVAVYNISEHKGVNIMESLKKFIAKFPQLKNAAFVDLHGASLYVNGGVDKHTADNFIFIGDAASQINPLAGEGIRHAMHSARIASKIIIQALDKKDFSQHSLSQYDKEWKKYIGRKWKQSLLISQKIYSGISGKEADKFMKILAELSNEDIFALGFDYNYKKVFNRKTVIKWLKSAI